MINNIYDVHRFDGSKTIILSTAGPLGGKNNFLAIAYIIVGILNLIIAGIFVGKKKFNENFGKKTTWCNLRI